MYTEEEKKKIKEFVSTTRLNSISSKLIELEGGNCKALKFSINDTYFYIWLDVRVGKDDTEVKAKVHLWDTEKSVFKGRMSFSGQKIELLNSDEPYKNLIREIIHMYYIDIWGCHIFPELRTDDFYKLSFAEEYDMVVRKEKKCKKNPHIPPPIQYAAGEGPLLEDPRQEPRVWCKHEERIDNCFDSKKDDTKRPLMI